MVSSGDSDAELADDVDMKASHPKVVSKAKGERRLGAKVFVGGCIALV